MKWDKSMNYQPKDISPSFVYEFNNFLPVEWHLKGFTVSYSLVREGRKKKWFLVTLKSILYRCDEILFPISILLNQQRQKYTWVKYKLQSRLGGNEEKRHFNVIQIRPVYSNFEMLLHFQLKFKITHFVRKKIYTETAFCWQRIQIL